MSRTSVGDGAVPDKAVRVAAPGSHSPEHYGGTHSGTKTKERVAWFLRVVADSEDPRERAAHLKQRGS